MYVTEAMPIVNNKGGARPPFRFPADLLQCLMLTRIGTVADAAAREPAPDSISG